MIEKPSAFVAATSTKLVVGSRRGRLGLDADDSASRDGGEWRPHASRFLKAVLCWAVVAPFAFGQNAPAPEKDSGNAPSSDELYEQGKALFDQFAPPEVKEQFEFPSKEQWDEFAARLQHALDNDDLAELAKYEPEAKAALVALRALPGYDGYADWLEERIDYIEAAKQTQHVATAEPKRPPATETLPAPKTVEPVATPTASIRSSVPYFDLWRERIRARPVPSRADDLMPVLRNAFAGEGVPPEFAWIAEAESTLNPSARSPSGAKGLFQLMPDTAKNLGLSTFLPDERTDAEKSARAAARYLRTLRDKFGEWPLAFAAYNAGEGRVQRLLEKKKAQTFAAIASSLPSETRMYVPKVCATIAVRSGVSVEKLGLANAEEFVAPRVRADGHG